MITFLVKRLAQLLMVMLVISLIAFAMQSKWGDPIAQMTAMSASAEEKAALRESLGLNDPFLVQYGRYLSHALKGDFGTSYFFKRPTIDVILETLPATVELVMVSACFVIGLSIPLGIYTAIHPRRLSSKIIMGVSTVGISIPVFLTAILLLFVFSQWLRWLPSFGRGDVVELPIGVQACSVGKAGNTLFYPQSHFHRLCYRCLFA